VADAVRPAVLERLPDRRRAERLTGVDRDAEVLLAAVLERLQVDLRRMAGLLARDVEADAAPVAERDGELRHLERVRAIAHRAHDLAEQDRVVALRAVEAARDGRDHLLQVHPPLRREDRRVPDLGVDDAVRREIRAALVRDPLHRFGRLHDCDRVGEAAQVQRQRAGRGARAEPAAELGRIGRRQPVVLELLRELDDGLRPEAAVEVVVEEHLRRGPERVELERRYPFAAADAGARCPVATASAMRVIRSTAARISSSLIRVNVPSMTMSDTSSRQPPRAPLSAATVNNAAASISTARTPRFDQRAY